MPFSYPNYGALNVPSNRNQFHIDMNDKKLLSLLGGENRLLLPEQNRTLFFRPPSFNDLIQEELGDCYILSPLSSVLVHPAGADYIVSMFCKLMIKGRPKICIRLFYRSESNFQAYYIYLDPTLFVAAEDGLYFHSSATWAHYIEKAYVGLLAHHRDKKLYKDGRIKNFKEVIYGGCADSMYEFIFGEKAECIKIKSPYTYKGTVDSGLTGLHNIMEYSGKETELCAQVMFDKLLKPHLVKAPFKVVVTQDHCRQFLLDNLSIFANIVTKHPLYDLSDWSVHLRQTMHDKLSHEARREMQAMYWSVLDCLDVSLSLYHPKRGLGKYSIEEEDLFRKITTGLAGGELLSCATPKDVGREGDTSKGILDSHVYSVLGYRNGNVNLPNGQQRNLKFLIIKNPWENNIRHYNWKEKNGDYVLSARMSDEGIGLEFEDKIFGSLNFNKHALVEFIPSEVRLYPKGVFAIELSDFLKRFTSYFRSVSLRHELVRGRAPGIHRAHMAMINTNH